MAAVADDENPDFDSESGDSLYEPWVRIALDSPPWSRDQVVQAQSLVKSSLHLGEVAEAMRCSVFEVQAELRIGRRRDIRSYRRIRGLD